MIGSKEKDGELLEVKSKNLPEFLNKIQYIPDYIFMDIEGFEIDVFDELAVNFLKTHNPIIVFEIHEVFYRKEKDLSYIKKILDKHQYKYRQIADNLVCFPYGFPFGQKN